MTSSTGGWSWPIGRRRSINDPGSRAGQGEPPAEAMPDFGRPLTPSAVGQVQFTTAARGYRREEVEAFRNRVRHQLQRNDREKGELRTANNRLQQEVQRLHDYYRTQNSDLDIPGEVVVGTVVASDEAVALYSQAQQAADAQLADAEQQARQIVDMARQRYEDLLARAHAEASRALNEATRRADAGGDGEQAQQWRDLAVFVQAFTAAMENDVRAVLDRGRHELDRRVAEMRAAVTAPEVRSVETSPSAPPALAGARRVNGSPTPPRPQA